MSEHPLPEKNSAGAQPPPRRPRRKKIRYRKMAFKLTQGQLEALVSLCRHNNTTPIRYLKSLVNHQVERYRTEGPPVSYVTENQLELFDVDMYNGK
ncbi:MAG: hypothetical protein R6U64_00600 [Bacteroidales bacterium]